MSEHLTVLGRMLPSVMLVGLICSDWGAEAAEPLSKAEAGAALRRAVAFFRTQVSTGGGYLWCYSEDLSRREGEGKASTTFVHHLQRLAQFVAAE